MRTYFTLDLYKLDDAAENLPDEIRQLLTSKDAEAIDEVLAEAGEAEDEEDKEPVKPYRSVSVSLDKGCMVIKSVSDDPAQEYEIEYPEQLTNEFLIQVEMLDIRKWDPMHYSPAYDGGEPCSWEMDYNGLKGGEAVRSGRGTYPKGWPQLIELIGAYKGKAEPMQEGVHIAAGYAASLFDSDGKAAETGQKKKSADPEAEGQICHTVEEAAMQYTDSGTVRMADMVYLLSVMRMPQDVIAAGIVRAAALERGYDEAVVRDGFRGPVADLLEEYGNDWNLPERERRTALIGRVRESDSIYFKRLVLAEVMSMLIRVKAGIDAGKGFVDSVMTRDEMGLYCAEIVSSLSELERDDRSGMLYSVMVDMYKSIFVSYSLDSVRGTIYQMQGSAAGVILRRGEYEWRPMQGAVPDDACPVSKDLALFLSDCWRKQADEEIVKSGSKASFHDVPDLKVLKVVMSGTADKKAKKDNEAALSVLNRMVSEGEQVLAALHAGRKELNLIERGDIDDVANIPVSFLGLEDDEGNKMAAIFTSIDEIGEIGEDDIEAVSLKTLLRFVKHMDRLDGIIIDPFSDRFFVTKEKIAEILDGIENNSSGM